MKDLSENWSEKKYFAHQAEQEENTGPAGDFVVLKVQMPLTPSHRVGGGLRRRRGHSQIRIGRLPLRGE
jgi:hypothetical protein